jgi:peroxiredoxin
MPVMPWRLRKGGHSDEIANMPHVHEAIQAPEFQRGEWINSPPLTLAQLHGTVVLVYFWDYTCINCLRPLPYLHAWWQRYRDLGFTIVGIHTPKYLFSAQRQYVELALERLQIDFPLLLDTQRDNWHAWANRFWPAGYLLDPRGRIYYFQYGEGRYQEIEFFIQTLLQPVQPDIVFPAPVPPLRMTDEAGVRCYRATPELECGYQRGSLGNPAGFIPDKFNNYLLPTRQLPDTLYIDGAWHSGGEALTLVTEQGSIAVHYQAKEVNLVVQPPKDQPGLLTIEQDGLPLPTTARGMDVALENAAGIVCIDTPRMYVLINNPQFGAHHLLVHALTPGMAVYSMSFVTDCYETEEE